MKPSLISCALPMKSEYPFPHRYDSYGAMVLGGERVGLFMLNIRSATRNGNVRDLRLTVRMICTSGPADSVEGMLSSAGTHSFPSRAAAFPSHLAISLTGDESLIAVVAEHGAPLRFLQVVTLPFPLFIPYHSVSFFLPLSVSVSLSSSPICVCQ